MVNKAANSVRFTPGIRQSGDWPGLRQAGQGRTEPGQIGATAETGKAVAGEEGFEPSLPDPESGVLPLDDSPVHGIL